MTNTARILELEKGYAWLSERVHGLGNNLTRVESTLTKWVDELTKVTTRLAVLEVQLADLKKAVEESERKRWTLWLAVVGSVLTLVVNVILLLLRR